jgi:hypothetical protein
MNPWQPRPMSFLGLSPGVSDDVEMLQTDVMRFFAILCLCLMAIFALVKALPMAPAADTPTIAKPPNLKAEAEVLQKQIAALKKMLVETQAQLQMARTTAEQVSAQSATAKKTEQAVFKEAVKARQELKRISQLLSETQRKIAVHDMKLAKIVTDIAEKRQIQAELKIQIAKETQSLAKIRTTLDQAREKLAHSPSQNQETKPKPPEAAPQTELPKKGFSLRFATEAALETLINRGKVDFYAIAGKKAWQLKIAAGRPVYISAKTPHEVYEMENLTVPITYASAFQRQVAAFGRDTITWGVTLPSQTISSINHLIEGRKGGDLVITADGEVSLK